MQVSSVALSAVTARLWQIVRLGTSSSSITRRYDLSSTPSFRCVNIEPASDRYSCGLTIIALRYVGTLDVRSLDTAAHMPRLTGSFELITFGIIMYREFRLKTSYWELLIDREKGNPSRLWATIADVFGRSTTSCSTPQTPFTADIYLNFVQEKIDPTRKSTENAPPPSFPHHSYPLVMHGSLISHLPSVY